MDVGYAESTYFLVVQLDNQAPTLAEGVEAAAEASVTAGEAYELDLSKIFTDPEGDALTYTVSVNDGEAAAANAAYTYTPEEAGTYTLVFKANDGKKDSEVSTGKRILSLDYFNEKICVLMQNDFSIYNFKGSQLYHKEVSSDSRKICFCDTNTLYILGTSNIYKINAEY